MGLGGSSAPWATCVNTQATKGKGVRSAPWTRGRFHPLRVGSPMANIRDLVERIELVSRDPGSERCSPAARITASGMTGGDSRVVLGLAALLHVLRGARRMLGEREL